MAREFGRNASLTRIIHKHFCCNRRSAAATSLRAAGSRRGLAISSLDPSASLGIEPERGRRLDDARDPEPVERATNCHE
ncbi:MAG: hypothetical protein OEY86_20810 [Nitrospira sp.]|nr:hypothetical protein [Nitrospira sp.]